MLSYAFTNLHQKDFEEVDAEAFDNLHNLFAAILGKGISQQIKHGLYREYRNNSDNLTALRGKIDLYGTISNKIARKKMISCNFDELSENNLLNQIIKSTVMILLCQPTVESKYKDTLKKCMPFFSNVGLIEPSFIPFEIIRFQRSNQSYRMLISICQLIIDGMLMMEESGEYRLASFIDEQRMCRLYEKFILEYYRKTFPELNVSASQIQWALDNEYDSLLPILQTDITISNSTEVLIIDAKYYASTTQVQYDTYKIHSSNLYQIFTYVKNCSLNDANNRNVSGMLLYARTNQVIQPNQVYAMSGNKISVKTLDLNVEFSEIAKQLNDIITNHFNI